MNHYKKLIENLQKHKMLKKSLDELDRKYIYKFLMNFSNRIDILEKFITEKTDFDGEKVGFVKYGTTEDAWLKNNEK